MFEVPLKRGRKFLNTPGPTNVPERVRNAMARATMDLSDPEFLNASESCFDDLKSVFKTEGECIIYIANGHGAWEAAIANCLSPGDTVLVPETGNFSNSWADMTESMQVNCRTVMGDWREPTSPEAIGQALADDKNHEIKAVLLVHTDTATSITCDVPAVREAMNRAKHPALLMVDTIASLGTVDYQMDAWGADVTVGASQKGLMCPPGLGLVAINDKAKAAVKASTMPRRYWDWDTRLMTQHYRRYCGTAPQLAIFGLRESLDMLFEEGLENVFTRHRILAEATHKAVDVWAQAGGIELNARDPKTRSVGVTTILTMDPDFDASQVSVMCRDEMMVALGGGLGKLNGKAFRIGHMGDVNAPMMYGALGAVEATLSYLGIPYTPGGVTAAIEHIAEFKKSAGHSTF